MVTTMQHPHPLVLLRGFEETYREHTPTITLKTSKRKFQDIKQQFQEDNEDMLSLLESSMLAHKIEKDSDEEKKLKVKFERISLRILKSHLSNDFEERYEDELRSLKPGSDDFFKLVGEIVGTASEEDLVKEAKRKLNDISRDSENEETFSRFITRVTKLAEVASKKVKILTDHFVGECWDRNLTPEIKRYILDQGKTGETPEKTAEFLDKMKKHKRRIEVREVSAREILLQQQIDALTNQFASVPEMLSEMKMFRESLSSSISSIVQNQLKNSPEIADIQKIAARERSREYQQRQQQQDQRRHQPDFRHNRDDDFNRQTREENFDSRQRRGRDYDRPARDSFARGAPGQQQNQGERRFPEHFEIAPDGRPYRCTSCGILGHQSRNCKGTSQICRYCGETGHIKFACPKKQSKN